VDGWVRPQYRDAPVEAPAGEYWTPVPAELSLAGDDPEPSAKGYGWPVPVERLRNVPRNRSATGFDAVPLAVEPTEVVPIWSPPSDRPLRIRLPRSWAARNERHNASDERQGGTAERYDASDERPDARGEGPHVFDDRFNGFEPRGVLGEPPGIPAEGPGGEPGARMLSAADQPGRPRPRPRPRPGPAERADRSTVYVSRHAADPPRAAVERTD